MKLYRNPDGRKMRLHLAVILTVFSVIAGCARMGFGPTQERGQPGDGREPAAGDGTSPGERAAWDGASPPKDGPSPPKDGPSPPKDGASPPKDGPSPPKDGASPLALTAANDTCATPLTVDLAGVNSGGSLTIPFNAAGVKLDYPSICTGVDVVLRFINSNGAYRWSCESAGSMSFAWNQTAPSACVTGAGGDGWGQTCGGVVAQRALPTGEVKVVLCSLGASTQTLTVKK